MFASIVSRVDKIVIKVAHRNGFSDISHNLVFPPTPLRRSQCEQHLSFDFQFIEFKIQTLLTECLAKTIKSVRLD